MSYIDLPWRKFTIISSLTNKWRFYNPQEDSRLFRQYVGLVLLHIALPTSDSLEPLTCLPFLVSDFLFNFGQVRGLTNYICSLQCLSLRRTLISMAPLVGLFTRWRNRATRKKVCDRSILLCSYLHLGNVHRLQLCRCWMLSITHSVVLRTPVLSPIPTRITMK